MHLVIIFYLFVAMLHTASAIPYMAPPFLSLRRLPKCAGGCDVLLETGMNCSPPRAPLSNNATYIECFCRSEYLRSLRQIGEICTSHCGIEAEKVIESTYDSLCSTPTTFAIPSATPSSHLATSYTSSVQATSTTSAPVVEPTNTSVPPVKDSQDHREHSQTWIQKHWRAIVAGILIPVFVLLLIAVIVVLYLQRRNRKRNRPMTHEESMAIQVQLLQARLEEEYGERARGLIVPLKTVKPNSFRARLSRLHTRNPITNRRQRPSVISMNTLAPRNRSPQPAEQGFWTPQRPASARTVASSIGQRSLSSPLSPTFSLAPPLPIRPRNHPTSAAPRSISSPLMPTVPRSDIPSLPLISPRTFRQISHAESLREYAEEQDMYKSYSSPSLRGYQDTRRGF